MVAASSIGQRNSSGVVSLTTAMICPFSQHLGELRFATRVKIRFRGTDAFEAFGKSYALIFLCCQKHGVTFFFLERGVQNPWQKVCPGIKIGYLGLTWNSAAFGV